MTSTLRGWGGWGWGKKRKNEMLSDLDGGGSKCTGRPIFSFFIKENWICAMTRNHAGPSIIILLTRDLPYESDVRQ